MNRKEYQKQYYQKNIERERANRRVSGKKYYSTPLGRYTGAKRRALKERNLEWTLTFEEYKEILNKLCYYCEKQITPMGSGLDRKDNSKGYSLDNVLPCCGPCNKIRNDELTVDEMKFLMRKLKEYRESN